MSTYVLFFGGYQSTLIDIKAWKASAMHYNPGYIFDGYPFPDNQSSDGGTGIAAFDKAGNLDEAIKKVQTCQADRIFIVGHSSGCAIANKVDAGLKDHTKITLVALDGYGPSPAQLERPNTQVWSAESGNGKSLNHDRMLAYIDDFNQKAKNKQKVMMFKASSDCTTKYALHFSLVNLYANDKSVVLITDGYKNCRGNFTWLPYL